MRSLLLHSTPTAQWQALLFEAQQTLSIRLQEELEAYLVFLLMRFTEQPGVAQSVLGLDFLEGTQHHSFQQPELLRNVGDKCLLFAGLFPERAQKRRITQQYCIQLGQTAYMSLANTHINESQSTLFLRLCEEFLLLTDILQATRDIELYPHDLMKEIESWAETGSQSAWLKIQQTTRSLPIPSPSKEHKKKFNN